MSEELRHLHLLGFFYFLSLYSGGLDMSEELSDDISIYISWFFYFLFLYTGGLTGLNMSEEVGDFSSQFCRGRVKTFYIGMKPPPHQIHCMQLPLRAFSCWGNCEVGTCTRNSKKKNPKSQCPSRCSVQYSQYRQRFFFWENACLWPLWGRPRPLAKEHGLVWNSRRTGALARAPSSD